MKNKDIFFIGNHAHDSYFKEVVHQLVSKNCLYGYMSHALIDAKNVELCFLDSTLLYRHQHLEQAFDNVGWTFGSHINIDSIVDCRAEIYAALDRISPYLKSTAEKELYFNKLSGYYIDFFEQHSGIKKILTRQTCHMPWDILFCRIAIHFGIKVYSVDRGVPGFAVIWDGVGESAVKCRGQSLSDFSVNELHDTITNHNSTNGLYVKTFLPRAKKDNVVKRMLVKFFPFLRVLSRLKTLLMEPIPLKTYPASLDTKPCTSFAGEERVNRLNYVLTWLAYDNERLKRKNILDAKGDRCPDYDSAYVYFPLHFQPESTTLPKGLIYREQILAVRRIREIIPDEIAVYVKEHPRQLMSDIRNKNHRNLDFYEEIMKLDGVKLLHPEVDSAGLIENSTLVVTITGSVAIEALPKGMPVIAFGNSIVEECNSLHKIISCTDSNKLAIKKLLSKSTTEVKADFLEFLKCPNWHEVCDNERSWKQVGYDYKYVTNMVDIVLRLGDSVDNGRQSSISEG
jgi:hypothetical protein